MWDTFPRVILGRAGRGSGEVGEFPRGGWGELGEKETPRTRSDRDRETDTPPPVPRS